MKRFLSESKDDDKYCPLDIADDEIIVRSLLSPLLYSQSKSKLKDPAFSPPPGGNEVSVLRHRYTTTDFCRSHSQSLEIADNEYTGMAIIEASSIQKVNFEHAEKLKGTSHVCVKLISSPLPNLHMHADIVYSMEFPDDEPKIQIRMIARELIKLAVSLADPDVTSSKWMGAVIDIKLLKQAK